MAELQPAITNNSDRKTSDRTGLLDDSKLSFSEAEQPTPANFASQKTTCAGKIIERAKQAPNSANLVALSTVWLIMSSVSLYHSSQVHGSHDAHSHAGIDACFGWCVANVVTSGVALTGATLKTAYHYCRSS